MVFGAVGIDMIAGPSEILVVADARQRSGLDRRRPAVAGRARRGRAVDPDHRRRGASPTAVDGGGDAAAADACRAPRSPRESWERHGAVIVVRDWTRRRRWSTAWRPSTCELAVAEPDALAARVRHAGAIFLGRHTPEAHRRLRRRPQPRAADRRAPRASPPGLGVLDFMKRTSLVGCDRGGPRRARAGRRRAGAKPRGWARMRSRSRVRLNAAARRRGSMSDERRRIVEIALDERTRGAPQPRCRARARGRDLRPARGQSFRAASATWTGPIISASASRRTGWSSTSAAADGEAEPARIVLPLTPFRGVVKDYFTICESYYDAIKRSSPPQIEAIDMGRRGCTTKARSCCASASKARSRSTTIPRAACSR